MSSKAAQKRVNRACRLEIRRVRRVCSDRKCARREQQAIEWEKYRIRLLPEMIG